MRTLARAALAAALLTAAILPSPAHADGGWIPPAGATIDAGNAAQVAGTRQLPDGRLAVPLRSASPEWLTPELVAAARERPTAAPPSAYPDVPASGYVGIRPGSEMVEPSGCTMNFVFATNSGYAIGTAGHCVEKVGQMVTLLTIAPDSEIPVLVTIGPVLARHDNGPGDDFALVAIPASLNNWVFPTIAGVGGPCGAYTGNGLVQVEIPKLFRGQDTSVELEQVAHYGHGLGVGTGGTPRTGVSLYWDADAFYWDSPAAPGDSGSAVRISTLEAAGDLTHLIVDTKKPGAIVAGTRITKMMQIGGGTLVDSQYCGS